MIETSYAYLLKSFFLLDGDCVTHSGEAKKAEGDVLDHFDGLVLRIDSVSIENFVEYRDERVCVKEDP